MGGCDEQPNPHATPAATSAAPEPAPTPSAVASEAPPEAKPSHACPDGSEGEGTLKDPCVAKGKARMMTVEWPSKKVGDKGPTFRVTNLAKLEVMWARIDFYFYDKAGKLIEFGGDDDHPAKNHVSCSGNLFAGPMKPAEKDWFNFDCVGKKNVPENTVHIEAEVSKVGFTASTGKSADTFWSNPDLIPNNRPKGGVK